MSTVASSLISDNFLISGQTIALKETPTIVIFWRHVDAAVEMLRIFSVCVRARTRPQVLWRIKSALTCVLVKSILLSTLLILFLKREKQSLNSNQALCHVLLYSDKPWTFGVHYWRSKALPDVCFTFEIKRFQKKYQSLCIMHNRQGYSDSVKGFYADMPYVYLKDVFHMLIYYVLHVKRCIYEKVNSRQWKGFILFHVSIIVPSLIIKRNCGLFPSYIMAKPLELP